MIVLVSSDNQYDYEFNFKKFQFTIQAENFLQTNASQSAPIHISNSNSDGSINLLVNQYAKKKRTLDTQLYKQITQSTSSTHYTLREYTRKPS